MSVCCVVSLLCGLLICFDLVPLEPYFVGVSLAVWISGVDFLLVCFCCLAHDEFVCVSLLCVCVLVLTVPSLLWQIGRAHV